MQKKVENISLEFETCFEHYFKILFWIFKLKSKIKARKKISIINIDNETKRNEKNKFEIVFFSIQNKQTKCNIVSVEWDFCIFVLNQLTICLSTRSNGVILFFFVERLPKEKMN